MCNFIDKIPSRRGRPVHPPLTAAELGYAEEPDNIDAEAEWAIFDMPRPNDRMNSDATVVNEQPMSVETSTQITKSAGKKKAVEKAVMQAGLVGGSPAAPSAVNQISHPTAPAKKSAWNPFKSKKKQLPEQPESSLDARSKVIDIVPFGPKRRTLPPKNNAGEGSSAYMAGPSGQRSEQNKQGTGANTTAGASSSTANNLTANQPFIQVSPPSTNNSIQPSTAMAEPSGQIPQHNEDRTGASTTASASNMIADFVLYDDDSSIRLSTAMEEPSNKAGASSLNTQFPLFDERIFERNRQELFEASTGTAGECLAPTEGTENPDTGNLPLTDDQESTEREVTVPEGSVVRELDSDEVAASAEVSEERTG